MSNDYYKSTLSEILSKYSKLQSVFENNGINGLDKTLMDMRNRLRFSKR